jgi:hypothetical protein
MAGYCGWPVATILVHSSAAKAALHASVMGREHAQAENSFHDQVSLFLVV